MATTPVELSTTSNTFPTRQKPIPYTITNGRRTPLSSILPPLVFGTATFNHQYNDDPFALDTTGLVTSALTHGIRAFDTSPYYGPSEQLLGSALSTPFVRETFPRNSYMILTKVGRIASEEFDYSKEWVRQSVESSLQRLQTEYLDLVYCHDVEFVSPAEVLEAVKELRRIRDEEGTIRYIGISGYPIDVLGDMAELILRETGEPLDAVQSYANFTLQNQTLASPRGIQRLREAGVDVVPNASILGMGLLRREGVPVGALGDFHPAHSTLREAVRNASNFCDTYGERIEVIAIRFALETWISAGSICGSKGDPASGVAWKHESNDDVGGAKLGVSVIGVSRASELEKTMLVWRSILDGLEGGKETAVQAGRWYRAWEWSRNRRKAVQILAEGVQEVLGEGFGYAWSSPDPGYVNKRKKDAKVVQNQKSEAPWLTPAASPQCIPVEDLGEVREEKNLPLR
ncbi:L-galactose dehydrogenase (L-GalDH) [Cucurbitaria berberidis CBS 394.84]|uniref:L-galactose dehydrogenase (L-GalDH) n=1 Tax=Cucurbitaria berberidis CBS 394.84 TaxID=1168544 RepID=A0A9P4GAH0_9PLEO|nr:L-galactose dehydrogenase (L-GalDH) [Cucurbitaria berberidis CBS 394.84]KAF1842188.1 L-galactose dehydrogenase (L-GalDH) [Cucurbitaria berberidis CBS 394.84]